MKKLTKLGTATFGLALGVTTLFGQPLSISNVLAGESLRSYTLPSFTTEFSGYREVELPFATGGAEPIAPKVYTQNNSEIQDSNSEDNKFTFTPERSVYKVVYTLNGVDKVFNINVNLVKPVLSLGNDVILPNKVNKDAAIALPYPTVLDAQGNALLNASGEEYTDAELKGKVAIVVTAPNGQTLTDTDTEGNIGTLVKNAQTGIYTLTTKALGDYSVKYSFKSDNTLTGELTKTINVSNTFKTEREITYTLSGSMPSLVLGVEATLPKVNVNDKTNDLNGIDAKATITAKYIKADGTYSAPIAVTNYKFTPVVAGDYIFTYSVEDYFGNTAPATNYIVRSVKDSKAPTKLTVVDAYAITGDGVDVTSDEFKAERVSVEYKIPSKIAKGTEVVLPAIYAEDNMTGLNDMIFVRNIKEKYRSASSSVTLDANFNENARYTFANEGTFVVTYSATDKAATPKTTTKTFEIVVTEGYNDSVAPVIDFSSVLATMYNTGDKITFNQPTAIDYNDAENKIVGDARLNVKTFWYLNDDVAGKTELKVTNGKIEFIVPSVTSGSTITILAQVEDISGNASEVTKTFEVINDVTPIQINMVKMSGVYEQGEDITIPSIYVSDNDSVDTIRSISIEVYNKNGNKVSVSGLQTTTNANNRVLSGATFKAINSGDYSILCVATDLGNNVTVVCQKISVEKTSIPTLKIDKTTATVALGDEFDLNIYSVYDEGVLLNDANVEIAVNGSPVAVDKIFEATSEGNFEVVYTYNYGTSEEPQILTQTLEITVSDDTKPELIFTDGQPKLNVATTGEITLPAFDASDNNEVTLDVIVKFKSSTGTNQDIAVEGSENGYTFVAESKGTYEVTYKAVDAAGNETTKVYNIVVGDKTGPVIEFEDESVFMPSTKKLNDVLAFDLSSDKVNVYDAVDESVDYKNVIVKLVGPDGNKVSDNDNGDYSYSFNLTQVGTYKLTYTVSDEDSNTTTVTQNIEVTTETIAPTESNDVGMVLAIIASLAVLAGVIIYFFKPEKNSRKDERKSKKDAE